LSRAPVEQICYAARSFVRRGAPGQCVSCQVRSNLCSLSLSIPALDSSFRRFLSRQVSTSLIVVFSGRKLRPALTALLQLMNIRPFKCGATSSGIQRGISLHAATFSCLRKLSVTHVKEASLSLTILHSSSTLAIVRL